MSGVLIPPAQPYHGINYTDNYWQTLVGKQGQLIGSLGEQIADALRGRQSAGPAFGRFAFPHRTGGPVGLLGGMGGMPGGNGVTRPPQQPGQPGSGMPTPPPGTPGPDAPPPGYRAPPQYGPPPAQAGAGLLAGNPIPPGGMTAPKIGATGPQAGPSAPIPGYRAPPQYGPPPAQAGAGMIAGHQIPSMTAPKLGMQATPKFDDFGPQANPPAGAMNAANFRFANPTESWQQQFNQIANGPGGSLAAWEALSKPGSASASSAQWILQNQLGMNKQDATNLNTFFNQNGGQGTDKYGAQFGFTPNGPAGSMYQGAGLTGGAGNFSQSSPYMAALLSSMVGQGK